MTRISRDEMLMKHAVVAAMRGTCSRLKVGAVFSRDGRIITTGYNGAPAGVDHCDHSCDCPAADDPADLHSTDCASMPPCLTASHAERNGIDFAAKHGLSLEGSELHVTHMPCLSCAGSLLNVGVTRVLYRTGYRLTDGVEMLQNAGISVAQFSY